VRREELAGLIDEQVVQLGAQRGALGHPEVAGDERELTIERALPVALVELDLALADLPGVPHPRVEQRLLAQTIPRRLRHRAQLVGCTMRQRQGDRSDANDVEKDVVGPSGMPGRERSRRGRAREDVLNPIDRGHHPGERRRSGQILACEHPPRVGRGSDVRRAAGGVHA